MMANSYENPYSALTSPICETWTNLLRAAESARRPFMEKYDQIMLFYSEATRFLWEDETRVKYLGPNAPIPKFQVTVNKAFEYIALFVPMLCWQNPTRRVTSKGTLSEDVMRLAGPIIQADPNLQMLLQQQQMKEARDELRNAVWEDYLGRTPNEQPDGGLRGNLQMSITDALLSGRGILVPRTYGPPESALSLTGLFYEPVTNLLIDPDSVHPHAADAQWLSLMHVDWWWDVERRFPWIPPGTLRSKGNLSSIGGEAGRIRKFTRYGQTQSDLIVWYEIWSRCGMGSRYTPEPRRDILMGDRFDEVVGDHAYLCITDCCNYPLNLTPWMIGGDPDEEVIAQALQWPVPFYKDNRWPLAMLDFYPNGPSPWPLPPLWPCIGEMICLQILLSIYLDNAHANTQSIIGCLKDMASQVQNALKKGENPAVIEFSGDFNKNVNEVIQFLNRPNQNTDLLQAMEFVMSEIERKSGLSELLFGRNPGGTQDRSAASVQIKAEKVNIRPEYMGNQVADFVSQGSDLERILAYWTLAGRDVEYLLGPAGAYLWDTLVKGDPEDVAIRGLRTRVEASDLRRPNKERDSENLNGMMQYMIPLLQQLAVMTGDIEPVNGFIRAVGRAAEMDVDEFLLPPLPDNSDMQQRQGAMMDAETQEKIAKAQKALADAQAVLMQAQSSQGDLEGEQALNDQQLGIEGAKADQQMQHADEKATQTEEVHRQKIQQNAMRFWQRMQSQAAMDGLKMQAMKSQANNRARQPA